MSSKKKEDIFKGVFTGDINSQFDLDLIADSIHFKLWRPDARRVGEIVVRKEIWYNVDGEGDGLGNGLVYPVYHVYDYLNPPRTQTADSGTLINAYQKPYRTFNGAMRVVRRIRRDALATGMWVIKDQLQ